MTEIKNTNQTIFAISSLGNIGEAVLDTYIHDNEFCLDKGEDMDMKCAGIIRRSAKSSETLFDIPVVQDVRDLEIQPTVIICCAPSHVVLNDVKYFINRGFSVVDCFDGHGEIFENHTRMNAVASAMRKVHLHATGWDPGFDSVGRTLMYRMAPFTETFQNFGPGRSMGHTTELKAEMEKLGIENPQAVSITSHLTDSKGALVPGWHKRDAYVVLPAGFDGAALEQAILANPKFSSDIDPKTGKPRNQRTYIHFEQSIEPFDTVMHGGYTSNTDSRDTIKVEINLNGNNPIMTSRMMYSGARAVDRLVAAEKFGCYLDSQIAPLEFVKGKTLKDRMQRVFI